MSDADDSEKTMDAHDGRAELTDDDEDEQSEAVRAFLRNSKPHRSAPSAPVNHEIKSSHKKKKHRKNSAGERPPVVSRSYENNQGGLGKLKRIT